ncbi:hypothetical protein BGZ63DRAFT_465521 [Mariannaea sp. PMI_226]|nr:hypothetical protein BGZ63DRAFT_465521 [Mariannaea sp. PMI_226]
MTKTVIGLSVQCLRAFDRVLSKHSQSILTRRIIPEDAAIISPNQERPSCNFLGLQKSFSLWIDYAGALVGTYPLNTILKCSADISSIVIELLEIILQALGSIVHVPRDSSTLLRATSDSKYLQSFLENWDNASQDIDSALNELHFWAVMLRKVGTRRLDGITTSPAGEDIAFRKDAACLVHERFPAAHRELRQQLGDSIAVRRERLLKHWREAMEIHTTRWPALETCTKRHMTSTMQDESLEYPLVPTASEGETRVQCPFCYRPLERKASEEVTSNIWKRHIDEHIKPYTCLYPMCGEFFARRHQWKAHMENRHAKDWLRKVHTSVWYCDIEHESTKTFATESEWREHLEDLQNHPKQKVPLTEFQLDALSPQKRTCVFRGEFVCPLCEQTPKDIRHLAEKAGGDRTEAYNALVNHVADHLQSLALMAVPPPHNKYPTRNH